MTKLASSKHLKCCYFNKLMIKLHGNINQNLRPGHGEEDVEGYTESFSNMCMSYHQESHVKILGYTYLGN